MLLFVLLFKIYVLRAVKVLSVLQFLTSVFHCLQKLLAETETSQTKLQCNTHSLRKKTCSSCSCGNSNFVSSWRSRTHSCVSYSRWKEMDQTTETENKIGGKGQDSHFIHHVGPNFSPGPSFTSITLYDYLYVFTISQQL